MILKLKRGWLEIPKNFQEKLNLKEDDEIILTAEQDHLIMKIKNPDLPPIHETYQSVEEKPTKKIKLSQINFSEAQKQIDAIKRKEEKFREKELYSIESYTESNVEE